MLDQKKDKQAQTTVPDHCTYDDELLEQLNQLWDMAGQSLPAPAAEDYSLKRHIAYFTLLCYEASEALYDVMEYVTVCTRRGCHYLPLVCYLYRQLRHSGHTVTK